MKKLGKGFLIGTAAVILGSTGVLAAGWDNAERSQVQYQDQTCSWCQDSHCNRNVDKNANCGYYNSHRDSACSHSGYGCSAHHNFTH